MTLKARLDRLESRGGGPRRIWAVSRYGDETTDDAMSAEHPGVVPGDDDLIVVTMTFDDPRPEASR